MATRIRIFCWVLLAMMVLPTRSAPKKKSTTPLRQTVYDQKQTGDYNVHLHLKDFQIIALLGEDSTGGDYLDYSYDYNDFTVKPGTNKPSSESTPSSSPSPSPSLQPVSTSKPVNHPYPILSPSPDPTHPKEKPNQQINANHTEEPHQLASVLNEVDKTEKPANSSSADTEKVELASSTTRKDDNVEEPNSPGKIKVQIIETPVHVVPGEEVQSGSRPGEIVQMRRCVTGFARDKKGRCRRVRRPAVAGSPQLPYGFGRLASNLVSRFRHPSPDTSLSSSSESTEN